MVTRPSPEAPVESITNTAEVIDSELSDPDSTPGNNVETEDDQDSATVIPQVKPVLCSVAMVWSQVWKASAGGSQRPVFWK